MNAVKAWARRQWPTVKTAAALLLLCVAVQQACFLGLAGIVVVTTGPRAGFAVFLAALVAYFAGRHAARLERWHEGFRIGWRSRGAYEGLTEVAAIRDVDRARAEEKSELDRYRIETIPKPQGGAS